MNGTERPGKTAVRLALAVCAGLAACWVPAGAAPAAPQASLFATARPLASFMALQAQQELETLGQDVLGHFSGRKPSTFDLLDARLKAVEARLTCGAMLPAEAEQLGAQVKTLREVLTNGRSADAPRLRQLAGLLASSPKAGRLDQAASLLRFAADDPLSASRIFDNQALRGQSAVMPTAGAAADQAGRAQTAQAPAKATDLRLKVPAPGAPPAAAKRPVPGSATFISARIARVAGAPGQGSDLEVGVSDLLRQPDARSRAALSRQIAGEALSALGLADKDGALAGALADFLRDIAEYRPDGAVSAHLNLDGKNHFRLIFERNDKSRRIMMGQFLPGTGPGGKPGPMSFILMGPIEVSAAGQASEAHRGYWREYQGRDLRLEWGAAARTEKKGWGPWSHQNELQDVSLTEQVWREGRWQAKQKKPVKTVITQEGKSWFGRTGEKIDSTPVLGDTLKFCDKVAATLYTGIIAAPQVFITAASHSDTFSLETGGSYAKNPLMNLLIDDQGHLDRLSPGAQQALYARVREERRRALESQMFPASPEIVRQAVSAPIAAKEAVTVLRTDYGASTYGKRLLHEGGQTDGWKGAALTASGVVVGAGEAVGESVCNPILWATLGLGEAVTAAKGTAAVAQGAVGATVGLRSLQVAHAAATALWWGPWLVSATDNTGRLVETTAEGKFDKHYFQRVTESGTDALYFFLIP